MSKRQYHKWHSNECFFCGLKRETISNERGHYTLYTDTKGNQFTHVTDCQDFQYELDL